MKNAFFALAFMLIGSFAFANDECSVTKYEVYEIFGTCTYTTETTTTLQNGLTFTTSQNYETTTTSYSNCVEKANEHVAFLNAL